MDSNARTAMRVGIDVTAVLRGPGGMARYARELTTALGDVDRETRIIPLSVGSGCPTVVPRRPGSRPPNAAGAERAFRLQTLLAHMVGASQERRFPLLDLFHGTDNLLPAFRRVGTVLTLHDFVFRLFPRTTAPLNRLYLKLAMPHFLRRADALIAVSNSTRMDAERLYGVTPQRVHVVPLGVSERFAPRDPGAVRRSLGDRYRLPVDFLLHVGALEPRKNLQVLLEALRWMGDERPTLVLAGPPGRGVREIRDDAAAVYGDGRVISLGPVPEEDLPGLYSLARAFVFPSLYEGFGLPVLEAMACGTPVLCSKAAALEEVVGDGALRVDAEDVAGWAEAVRALWSRSGLRQELRRRGFRRARGFTWAATAQKTLEVYKEVHARRSGCSNRH